MALPINEVGVAEQLAVCPAKSRKRVSERFWVLSIDWLPPPETESVSVRPRLFSLRLTSSLAEAVSAWPSTRERDREAFTESRLPLRVWVSSSASVWVVP